jgi:hypothetical protein
MYATALACTHWQVTSDDGRFTRMFLDYQKNPTPTTRTFLENLGTEPYDPDCNEGHQKMSCAYASGKRVGTATYSHNAGGVTITLLNSKYFTAAQHSSK